VKKVNKKSLPLRDNSLPLRTPFCGQTASSLRPYGRSANINITAFENKGAGPGNLQILCTYKKSQPRTAKVKPPYIFQMVID